MTFQPATQASMDQLRNDLQQAADLAFNPNAQPYKRVTVILCHFDNDDLDVVPLENDLATTFEKVYGFKIIRWIMKASALPEPGATLHWKLTQLGHATDMTSEGSLTILVFSGHGRVDTFDRRDRLTVGGAVDKFGNLRGKTVDWIRDTSTLQRYGRGDVLHILDCCNAGEAVDPDIEVLAATSPTESAAADPENSFTRALNNELRLAAGQGAITVASLFHQVKRYRWANRSYFAPYYGPRPHHPSIRLQKLNAPRARHVQLPPDGPRILITAHVEGTINQKTTHDFQTWLTTNIPEHMKGMKIELAGAWKADSTQFLFSMPLPIGCLFLTNPAYKMIQIVYSDNLAIMEAPKVLAIRPVLGSENQNPGQASLK